MDKCDFVSSADGARLCLGDLEFPASKEEILDRMEVSGAPEAAIVWANQIPDKVYESLDELVKCLEGTG